MITKFSKGFYGKPREHAAFLNAVGEGDCAEIAATMALAESERVFVDPFVKAMPRRVNVPNLLRVPLDPHPPVDSVELLDELQQVYDLAEMRDMPMDELPKSLPRGMREVSPFLQRVRVANYKDGVNYGVDHADWESIQRGDMKPAPELGGDRRVLIRTGRDAAAYVHTDHFFIPWLKVLNIIWKEGIRPQIPESLKVEPLNAGNHFAVYGEPYWGGVLGEALRVCGLVSFYHKWDQLYPRPEEIGHYYGMDHLPLAYPEGSPMHPSRDAMHSAVALVMAECLKLIFSPSERLEFTGESLSASVDLKADNVGYWRVHAGVHYASDHECFRSVAKAIAEHVVRPHLRAA